VENPMGQGGMYLKLGDGTGEVDVRVPDETWQTYDDDKKDDFSEGKTLTAEGILFRAGSALVVIYEKYEYTSGRTSK
jgi:hypothetical protein